MEQGPVAIVAGQGQLPVVLARDLRASNRDVVLAEMSEFPVSNPEGLPVISYRPERLGELFRSLKKSGVRDLVFAGSLRRPHLDPSRFDLKTLSLAPRLLTSLQGGDDQILRTILKIFENQGFVIRAAHDVAPELLPPAGVPTKRQPEDTDRKDTARAAYIVASLAHADVGQAAVVAQGVALAIEAAPGTDRMLEYVANHAGEWRPDANGAGGVVFKGPKPGQDRRADLPLIGPDTVRHAVKAGLAGIAVEADGVMVLSAPECVSIADEAGLFIWIRPADKRAVP